MSPLEIIDNVLYSAEYDDPTFAQAEKILRTLKVFGYEVVKCNAARG